MSDRHIPQADVLAGFRAHEASIRDALNRVLESGWYILGKEVETFERRFSQYVGVDHGIGVASGTDAIEVALRSLGIGPGDLVLTVSHTAVATVAAIERSGAQVGFVDIDSDTMTMSPSCLQDTITSLGSGPPEYRLAAIVPVHLYGHMADMHSISEIARRHGLRVIEDCAQAHGARRDGRRAGSWGDAAAFSFYPTKNLGAIGDGGMIVTADRELAEQARQLRQYGWRERYISDVAGVNSRLDELQASILNAKLDALDKDNQRRIEIADRYTQALSDRDVEPPRICEGARHVFHQYVIRCDHRDDLRKHLSDDGIGTALHYPQPVHQQNAYRNRPRGSRGLASTDAVTPRIVSLPMYPELTDRQVSIICESLQAWLR